MAISNTTFTATGTGKAVSGQGGAGIFSIQGITAATATVQLQVSFDGGQNWLVYSTLANDTIANLADSPDGVVWRFECTAYTSGTIDCYLAT